MATIEPNWTGLLLFCAAFAACCYAFFTVIGLFPLQARPASLSGAADVVLIVLNLVLLVALAAGVFLFAHDALRWTSIVVAGGLIFLFVPSLYQAVPQAWRETRSGLMALSLLQIVALAAVLAPAGLLTAVT